MAPPEKFEIRYFLWTGEEIFRFPDKLHRDLLNGRTALSLFAGTRQNFVEIVIPDKNVNRATARGIVYAFDNAGKLDLSAVLQYATFKAPRFADANVVSDITPSIGKRHFQAQYTWEPPEALLDRIRASLNYGGTLEKNKIQVFKARKPS